ncbi:U-box domain-containing protein [Legionella yabuuchiae]|uniref:U-box domain-containing protein n=1 Tax=Legionella yabuuchiae TaxID=376727 RepID=UPI001054579D|nr:U-box domain-containing protein [Legionella yabuuchiae]
MREDASPRSRLSRFFSFLRRLWHRLIGRATPDYNLLLDLETPNNIQIVPLDISNTVDLLSFDRSNLELPTTRELYIRFMGSQNIPLIGSQNNFHQFFQNMQNDRPWREHQEPFFRSQQTAWEDPYHWWCRQEPLLSLPDPEDFRNSSKLAGNTNLDIPEEFICAITHQIMTEPVYDRNFPQQRYDRHAIERWLSDHSTNPYTRTQLTTENLIADDGLKERIDEFVANVLETSVALTPGNF